MHTQPDDDYVDDDDALPDLDDALAEDDGLDDDPEEAAPQLESTERQTWRAYAAATLAGIPFSLPLERATERAAEVADRMVLLERQRFGS